MDVNKYQEAALRTAKPLEAEELIIEGVLGLTGETGEIADHIKKYMFQGHEFDREHIAEELGDVCWYIAILSQALGYQLSDIMEGNIEKLKKRYPNGFEAERSIYRKEFEEVEDN